MVGAAVETGPLAMVVMALVAVVRAQLAALAGLAAPVLFSFYSSLRDNLNG